MSNKKPLDDATASSAVMEAIQWLDKIQRKSTAETNVWLAVDNEGTEIIFQSKPKRGRFFNLWVPKEDREGFSITVPQGTIKKLIGRGLTWDDEPVEYK